MRIGFLSAALLALTSSAALALELPVSAAYGTVEGCARAAAQPTQVKEDTLAVTPSDLFQGSELCFYTGVAQTGTDAAAPSWRVDVTCPIGHEDQAFITYTITEHPAEKLLEVVVDDGPGVEAELPLCPAP